MSRRVIAPVLLLIAAALSIAAVFVVHGIERAGGPLSQPSAVPPFVSPNGDGIQDEVDISFTTKRPERITVEVRAEDGDVVDRLLDEERVDGEKTVTWDGGDSGDGTYRAVITRAGDSREYETTERIVVDTTVPRGSIDRARRKDGRLTGLAFLEPGTTLVFLDADGTKLEVESRVFAPPNPDAESARPTRGVPRGLEVRLFFVDGMPARIAAQDLAGNRRELHASVVG